MKNSSLRFCATVGCFLLCGLTSSPAVVHETEQELRATGDFDGDGRTDALILDRETGFYRIGYQAAADKFEWIRPRASGIDNVTGLSVNSVLDPGRDAVVVTGPDANRVNVLDASDPGLTAVPVSIFPKPIGPHLVVAVDVGGGGNTPHADLYIGTQANGAAQPHAETLVRSTGGGAWSEISSAAVLEARSQAQRVRMKAGGSEYIACLAAGAPDILFVLNPASGAILVETKVGDLPEGARHDHGFFKSSALVKFIVYQPGKSGFETHAVKEVAPGDFEFSTHLAFDLDSPVQSLQVLPNAGEDKLLAIFEEGALAAVFEFDGENPPVLREEFKAPSGTLFTGAVGTGGANLTLLSGNGGLSTQFESLVFDGKNYTLAQSGSLPTLNRYSAPANVFLFKSEPFVTAIPGLVQSLNASDWSSNLQLVGGGPVSIEADVETYVNPTRGLDNPVTRTVGTAATGAHFGLPNQYMGAISVQSFLPAAGVEGVGVSIAPPPGPQKTGIQVSLTPDDAAATVFYRLASDANWIPYGGPFFIFRDTEVAYFARSAGIKSRIRHAAYTFEKEPSKLDSDEDGVPDFVEIGQGLDPLGGDDSDGDGFSDRNELVAGTDPLDSTDYPAAGERLEEQAAFDLALTPRPYDGTVPGETLAATGALMRLYDSQGGLFASGTTAPLALAGVTDPAALFTDISIDLKQRFFVAATDRHYDIATAGSDPRLGREMVKLILVPELMPGLEVEYTYGGGSALAESQAWIVAAQAAQAASVRERFTGDLNIQDTLITLLFEMKVRDLFVQRAVIDPADLISILSFRAADADRWVPSQGELRMLAQSPDGSSPGYSISGMLGALSTALSSPDSQPVLDLIALVEDIYRISSTLNNASPGTYGAPIDILRQFLESDNLDPAYAAVSALAPAQLTSAAAGRDQLLAGMSARPAGVLNLYVAADSFDNDCTSLYTAGLIKKSLFFPDGSPFLFPEAFHVLPDSAITVLGYTDLPPGACGGDSVEVISVTLVSAPKASVTDTDGDLIPDDYECAFFGGIHGDPHADSDGDGISDLQESLDGTDPFDDLSGAGAPVDLSPPEITIEPSGDSMGISLSWEWPAGYDDWIEFVVIFSNDLGTEFTEIIVTPVSDGMGGYTLELPFDETDQKFYQFFMRLKN